MLLNFRLYSTHLKTLPLLSVLALSIFLSACSSTPTWINKANLDTETHFVSVGTAQNLEAARANAIQNLSNRLIVNVSSSSYSQIAKDTNGATEQSFSSVGVSQSQAFNFVDIKTTASHQEDGQFHAQIKVNKDAFFKQIIQWLENEIPTGLLTTEQAIAQGLKLWPKQQKLESFITLLSQYRPQGQLYQGRLSAFNHEFYDALAQTKIDLIVADIPSIESLGIKSRLQQALSGVTNKAATHSMMTDESLSEQIKKRMALIIVGPNLKVHKQGNLFAVKVSGESVIEVDGKVLTKAPVLAIGTSTSLAEAKAQAVDIFVERLFVF